MNQALPPIRTVTVGDDRVLRVNGEPFIPIFAWWVFPRELDALSESGVNVALSPRADAAYAEAALNRGMYVGGNPRPGLAGHPGLLMWLQEDEPEVHMEGGPRFGMPEGGPAEPVKTLIERLVPSLEEREKACRKLDPARPVFINYSYLFLPRFWRAEGPCREFYSALSRSSDIVSWDIYPIAIFGREDFVPLVYDGTRRLREFAPGKPAYAFLECTQLKPAPAREPREEEMRNQAWQAIVAGATGIGWFTYGLNLDDPAVRRKTSFAVTPGNRAAMRRINDGVRRNTPAIAAKELLGGVWADKDGLPEVAVSLRADDKHVYLLAVNMRYDRRKVDWAGLTTWRGADESRIAAAKAKLPASALDELGPLEVRIIVVE